MKNKNRETRLKNEKAWRMKRRMYRIIQIFFFIPSSPNKLETFPNKHSTKWPTVILEGIAWGFTTISGLTPIKEVEKRCR